MLAELPSELLLRIFHYAALAAEADEEAAAATSTAAASAAGGDGSASRNGNSSSSSSSSSNRGPRNAETNDTDGSNNSNNNGDPEEDDDNDDDDDDAYASLWRRRWQAERARSKQAGESASGGDATAAAAKRRSLGAAAETLVQLSRVSRSFYALSSEDRLWRALCRRRWRNKKHTVLRLHPFVDYSHPPALLADMSVKELKSVLVARRREDLMKGVRDKAELRAAVAESLPKLAAKQKGCGFDRGGWGGKWKASYMVAERDSRRCRLTKDELELHFKYHQWGQDGVPHRLKFNQDWTLDSDMTRRMNWRFYMDDVQVEQYPALSIARDKDWGFRLSNDMVYQLSVWERPDESFDV
ncbi:hypothetical protein DFJ73DRAFT_779432 [Zopfochytrium polystomum]|nr:hypothetical protein DFJ73DRAFT_779432 [Zopfochytrium polystomum]